QDPQRREAGGPPYRAADQAGARGQPEDGTHAGADDPSCRVAASRRSHPVTIIRAAGQFQCLSYRTSHCLHAMCMYRLRSRSRRRERRSLEGPQHARSLMTAYDRVEGAQRRLMTMLAASVQPTRERWAHAVYDEIIANVEFIDAVKDEIARRAEA